MICAIYARLCSMVHEPAVLPALTQELIATQ
jgi:hypothetical protein